MNEPRTLAMSRSAAERATADIVMVEHDGGFPGLLVLMAHANTLRDELASLDPKTKIDVFTIPAGPLHQPVGGMLEHVGHDFIVVGADRVQLAHVVAFRVQN